MTDLMDMGDPKSRTPPERGDRTGPSAVASQIRTRGPVLFGKYELLGRIRRGGMAELFRGRELEDSSRLVAIKRILPSFTDEADYVAMFMDEARLGLRLKHPGIVEAFEIGQVEDQLYIALEHVHGQDLGALLAAARERGEPLPLQVAVRIALDLCGALHYAHELRDEHGAPLGIVHRDISPQNVLISYDGDVKLIDFGIAKSSQQLMRTQAGLLKGKHGYLSPEQARGEAVDRRSDLFSVGICLYEMLSGERLFLGSSDFSTIVRVRNAQVPDLRARRPELPSELAAIVHRALARDPAHRFPSAAELAAALQRFAETSLESCDRAAVGAHMREVFAEVLAGKVPEAAPDAGRDTGTGLLDAFDDVQAPSAVSALADLEPPSTVHALPRAEAAAPELAAELLQEVGPDEEAEAEDDDDETYEDAGEQMVAADVARQAPSAGDDAESSFATLELTQASPASAEQETRVVEYESTLQGALVEGATVRGRPSPKAHGGRAAALPEQPEHDEPERDEAEAETEASEPTQTRISLPAAYGTTLPGVGMGMDWDDDDQSTHVYDSPEHGAPAPAAVPYALPAPARLPSVQVFIPGTQQLPARNSGAPPGAPSPFTNASAPTPAPYPPSPSAVPPGALATSQLAPRTAPAPAAGRRFPARAVVVSCALLLLGALVWRATREPARAGLRLTTDPADAVVTLDGVSVGSSGSPFVLTEITPDVSHQVEVKRIGYRSWRTSLTLQAGQTVDLPHVQLMPEPKPRVNRVSAAAAVPVAAPAPPVAAAPAAPPAATQPAAITPAPPQPARAPRSTRATHARRVSRTRRASTHHETEAAVSSRGGTGTLRVNSRPWSQVLLDGRMVGNTPQMDIVVSAGRHTIALTNPDFGLHKVLTVQIKAGETVTKIVNLAN